MTNNPLVETIHWIESTYAEFYKHDFNLSAVDFLIDSDQLDQLNYSCEYRAAVLTSQLSDEFSIAIYLSNEIKDNIKKNAPLKQLNQHNIDHFCVLLEEISHFHFILNRISVNRTTSQLELEWQGEIDKFIFCNYLLEIQTKRNHLEQLKNIMFHHNKFFKKNSNFYTEVNFFAAKFCIDITEKFSEKIGLTQFNYFQMHMIKNYKLPMNEKTLLPPREIKIIAA